MEVYPEIHPSYYKIMSKCQQNSPAPERKILFLFHRIKIGEKKESTLSGRVESLDHGSTAPTELTVGGTLTSVDDS